MRGNIRVTPGLDTGNRTGHTQCSDNGSLRLGSAPEGNGQGYGADLPFFNSQCIAALANMVQMHP